MRRVFMGNKWRGEELLEMWAALLLLLEEAVADALTGGALDKLVAEAVACGCGIGGCGVSRQGCGLASLGAETGQNGRCDDEQFGRGGPISLLIDETCDALQAFVIYVDRHALSRAAIN